MAADCALGGDAYFHHPRVSFFVNVRFGSLADMSGWVKSVRFTPENRHSAGRLK